MGTEEVILLLGKLWIVDFSKIVAYDIPLPSLPHQVEESFPVSPESKHDAETLKSSF